MSQSAANDFSKWVPGFDFLQKMAASPGGAGTPSVSSWVAPTLDPKELERRIQDLKTVQFWLEQNTQAVAATIQALEVQRMTLATLRGMNLSMNELAESLKIKPETMSSVFSTPSTPAPAAAASSPSAPHAPSDQSHSDGAPPAAEAAVPEAAAPKARPAKKSKPKTDTRPTDTAPSGGPAAGVDPMAWWGSLTQQFQQIAQQAMTDIQRNTPPAANSEAASATASAPPARAKPASSKGRTAARKSPKPGTRTPRPRS